MLKKLIKHEWKRVWKLECLMVLVLAGVSGVGAILFQTPVFNEIYFGDKVFENEFYFMLRTMTLVCSVMVYAVMMIGATYGNIIWLGANFYKSMYTDEGYLTHTLPVQTKQLMFSKFFVGVLWTYIIQAVMFLSVALLFGSVGLSYAIYENPDFLSEVPMMLGRIAEAIDEGFFVSGEFSIIVHYLVMMLLAMLASPISSIGMVYGAMTIGQTANKYKALVGILAYFGLNMMVQVVSVIFQMIGNLNQVGVAMFAANMDTEYLQMHALMFFSYDLQLLVMLAMGIGLYYMSRQIVTDKLNLN